jgi:hypothetical protein
MDLHLAPREGDITGLAIDDQRFLAEGIAGLGEEGRVRANHPDVQCHASSSHHEARCLAKYATMC